MINREAAMKTAIVNLGTIVTGDWRKPTAAGDTIVMDDGIVGPVTWQALVSGMLSG